MFLTWSSSREAWLHSCLLARARTETHTHRMKDSKQLSVGRTLRVLSDSSGRKMLSFVCASGPNKSLVRNLWEAQAVGKECPPPSLLSLLWVRAWALISHWTGWLCWGPPGPGRQTEPHSLLSSHAAVKSISWTQKGKRLVIVAEVIQINQTNYPCLPFLDSFVMPKSREWLGF